jgi:hypothetical protein
MAHIDTLELVQMVNDLAERYTLEVQVERDGDSVWVRSHMLKPLILGVPTVAARHALVPLNLASIAPMLPSPLLKMR